MFVAPAAAKKISQNQKAKLLEYKEYSTAPIKYLYERFSTSLKGLSQEEAEERIDTYGYNEPARKKKKM